jgi:hypothetical protein
MIPDLILIFWITCFYLQLLFSFKDFPQLMLFSYAAPDSAIGTL